jgi:Domain of unknown function (DUF4410)
MGRRLTQLFRPDVLVSRAMIPIPHRLCLFCFSIVAMALAGCAGTMIAGTGGATRPKAMVVSDFVFSGDVVALDRGYTTRLERKVGSFPTYERKQRTNARVNDEIVATIIATLKEAGLDAQPGSEEGLTLQDDVVLISGRVQVGDQAKPAKNRQIGFGAGRGDVMADMALYRFAAGSKNHLLSFTTLAQSTRKPNAADRKQMTARNVAIEAALAAEGTPPVKLSADTEGQARRLGAAIGEKIVAFAKDRGWLAKVDEGALQSGQQPARMPPQRPAEKPQQNAGKPAT